jgi:hypothetical protein
MRRLPLPTSICLTAVFKNPTLEQRAAVLATRTTTDAVRLDQLRTLSKVSRSMVGSCSPGNEVTVMVESPLHTILADFKTFYPKLVAASPIAASFRDEVTT